MEKIKNSISFYKISKRFLLQSILIAAIFSCTDYGSGCYCEPPVSQQIDVNPDEVAVQFGEPSFIGDFSVYQSNGVNELKLQSYESGYATNATPTLTRDITWSGSGVVTPTFYPPFGTSVYYLTSNQPNPETSDFPIYVQVDLDDNLTDNDPDTSVNLLSVNKTADLQPGKLSTISTTIDVSSTPVLNLDVDTSEDNVVSNAYVYDVNCELIPITSANGVTVYPGNFSQQTTRINIAVMAEGYTGAEIIDYINYANNAFSTTANFHFGMTNDFFERYIQDFNFVRYDTISLESGVDTVAGHDNVYSILDYNIHDGFNGLADLDRIKAVLDKSKKAGKCALNINNVDAVVILVNTVDDPNPAHTWTFDWDPILHHRNGEPVHYIIVRAPVNGGGLVATDAIAHELGHAMGSLNDEYTTSNNSEWSCVIPMDPQARNISWGLGGAPVAKTNEKWEGIRADYNNVPTINFQVDYHEGGNYCDHAFFRPTLDSTMRYPEKTIGFSGQPQFGPLNTYYMYGTYLNRINPANIIPHQWSDYYYTGTYFNSRAYNPFRLEWPAADF
jgi:hypothetical protein